MHEYLQVLQEWYTQSRSLSHSSLSFNFKSNQIAHYVELFKETSVALSANHGSFF